MVDELNHTLFQTAKIRIFQSQHLFSYKNSYSSAYPRKKSVFLPLN